MAKSRPDRVKVLFHLEQDEDGYPPDDFESLWASKVGEGIFRLDNIPFFVTGVSCEDVVLARVEGNELHFEKLFDSSGHSTVRVIFFDRSKVKQVREFARSLGCASEQSHLENLIAIDVPSDVDYQDLVGFLQQGEQDEQWEYEEGCLRH